VTDGPAGGLEVRIPAGASLLIDSSVVRAYLAGGESASSDAQQVFDRLVATGRNPASLSMITVGEILVRPFRQGSGAVAIAEGFLGHFGAITLVPVTYEVAREGARIRASTNLPMPDALIVATSRVAEADLLVTTDRSWRPRLAATNPDVELVELGPVLIVEPGVRD
jgi:predicted nucleic acid-binding protein